MTRKQYLALFATIIGSGMVFLDGTVVNIALPHIAANLHASYSDLQWIVDGYLLSLSSLILLGGSLGDILGRRRIYIIGLFGFGATSLLSGLSPTVGVLIALRILQGVFGAMLIPGALAIINTNFPADLRSLAIGRWTAWSAITTAIGPLLGGYLVDAFSWRWIFLINIPLVIITLVLGRSIKESRDPQTRRIDLSGATLAILGLGGTTYGLIEGPVKHWQTGALLPLMVGIVLVIAFVRFEWHKTDPMLDLSLFRSRNFTGVNLATFGLYGALGGFFFALIIYLQSTLGFSGIQSGSALIPVTIILLLLSSRVGAWSAKHGSRLFMTVGPLIASGGMLLLIRLSPGANYWLDLMPGILLFGLGLALTVAPLTTTVMSSVSEAHSGIASAVNNAISRVAGLVVIALLGLFGAEHAYRFTIILCATLAASAGLVSYAVVRNTFPSGNAPHKASEKA